MRGALSKEIENGSKMSLDLGMNWIFVCGCRNKWRRATVGPRGRGRAQGVGCAPDPRGQVPAPPAVFSVPDILKYSRKIILNWHGILRTFIFGIFLYCTDKSDNRRKILIFILLNINNRK